MTVAAGEPPLGVEVRRIEIGGVVAAENRTRIRQDGEKGKGEEYEQEGGPKAAFIKRLEPVAKPASGPFEARGESTQ